MEGERDGWVNEWRGEIKIEMEFIQKAKPPPPPPHVYPYNNFAWALWPMFAGPQLDQA